MSWFSLLLANPTVVPNIISLLGTVIAKITHVESLGGTNESKRDAVVALTEASAKAAGIDITHEEIDELIIIALAIIKRNAKK